MFGLNTYLSTANAFDYVDQLFGKRTSSPANQPDQTVRRPSYDPAYEGTSARDRAMDAIIAIVWTMQHGGETPQSSVNEQGGYILDATGTEDADKIDIKAISAFNLATGSGDDVVNVKAGSVARLDAGEGNDTVNLAAAYIADVDGGAGDDVIQLAGDLADGISGGAGKDTIKVSADAMLGISGGDGDDTLYLEGKRIFASGGSGNDTITINNRGTTPAELSFARGDGKDTVSTNGGVNIRFGFPPMFGPSAGSASSASFTPDDVDISVSSNMLVLRSKVSDDTITIHFEPGALENQVPRFSFAMDQGDYVLKMR